MFLILGFKSWRSAIDQGQFRCPECKCNRFYILQQITRRFTIFFIPTFSMGKLGEVVQCDTCGTDFEPSVLEKCPAIDEPIDLTKCPACGTKLTGDEKECPDCGIYFGD